MKRIILVIGGALLWPAASGATEQMITMKNETYQPGNLAAKVGDTLRFVNDDSEAHNVFVPTVGYAFDLGKQEPDESRTITLGKPGRFDVECVIHGHMLMTVDVTP